MSFYKFINKAEDEVELRIQGQIVDDEDAWIYEWFNEPHASPNSFRDELANHKGKNLTVWIDSYGGDCFAAAGIYNALKEHKGNVTVKIDGKAMSAATVIAMAGNSVQMSPTAIFMVHNPLTWGVGGYAEDLRKVAGVLDTVKDSIINAYQLKTGRPRNVISDLMDNETYMSAKQALAEGFVDGILYTDGEEPDHVLNFSFNRSAIVNSADVDKIKTMLNLSEPEDPAEPEPAPVVEPAETINTKAVLAYLEMEGKIYE